MRLSRWIILAVLLTGACSGRATQAPAAPDADLVLAPSLESVSGHFPSTGTETPLALAATPSQPPTASPTPTPSVQVCSPLDGYELAQIQPAIANPFHPPPPGSDDPHQGIDIADTQPGEHIALAGRTVQAVLEGQVALVLRDRFPYGNAILIETPLDSLPGSWTAASPIPTLAPTVRPLPALTCPGGGPTDWDFGRRSLYLLYAHLLFTPDLKPSDPARCGQAIGVVGNSGNALNPHLHLEARLGPSGWRPGSLAHYDSSASLEEMENYCIWRVRGIFQLVDPLVILSEP